MYDDDENTLDSDSVDETIDTEDNTSSSNEVDTPPTTIHSDIGIVGDDNTVNITDNNSPLLGDSNNDDESEGTPMGDENNTTSDTTVATAIPIGSEGCFQNVIDKQLNPPTQNSKFIGYQVRKQEEAAKTTKIFAFGAFT